MYTEKINHTECQQIFFCEKIQFFCRSVWESFPFCRIVQDFFLFLGCFSFVASESSFFVGQTFWSSLSFFVGILTFGDLDDCRYYMKGGFVSN
ncbi:uncharacterized protein OCT59_009620 [Rhizophagus irregularis]|uniref:uncharacterized protein n=1 Tax=Rhizophagus irregularis TaxID=588596 RepID=UPI0033167339|nr:hypothetical protein OCT59_009620 [Rhizophagus irregularis]